MKLKTSFSINFQENLFEVHTYLADSVASQWNTLEKPNDLCLVKSEVY